MGRTEMETIAYIRTDFPEKFGIPRQAGLVEKLKGRVVFEPKFRNPDALRGLEGFSHIWLLWEFQDTKRDGFTATVRPPRLGGRTRMGVFATRSPFRPNPIGLSSVRLEGIEYTDNEGPVLLVSGADMRDMTPIFDIKPYIPYADIHEDATGGFTHETVMMNLEVEFPDELLEKIPEDRRETLIGVLAEDPRTRYKDEEGHEFGLSFAGKNIRFKVLGGVLHVTSVD